MRNDLFVDPFLSLIKRVLLNIVHLIVDHYNL